MSAPATAMVCYRYAFKVSPTLKNICSYLHEIEGVTTDVLVEDLHNEAPLHWEGVNLIDAGAAACYRYLLRPLLRMDKQKRLQQVLRSRVGRYGRIFAADFAALDMLHDAGYSLDRIVFVSLEGTDIMQHYDKRHVARLLAGCALRLVQSRERGADINSYLSSSLSFEYLPVSCRFQPPRQPGEQGRLRLIYTGYFAEWACLSEVVAAYRGSATFEVASLLMQGHSMGTTQYLSRLRTEASGVPALEVDTCYYDDAEYNRLLQGYDIGLAFYKNINGTANFENLILSSGKIATYLWNGLAVLTNVPSQYSMEAPFVFVDLADPMALRRAVEQVAGQRQRYMEAAYRLAGTVYNFDRYMGEVYQKLPPQLKKGRE